VIKDLVEPSISRSQDIDRDNKKLKSTMDKINRRLDASEHQIDKIEKKTASQDELFQKVAVLDQSLKINETRTMSELNNLNSNIELVKEKARSDSAEVDENGKQIKKLHESINHMHDAILEAKKELSDQIQKESKDLHEQILETKQYFEEQKDYVTQFDSNIKFLQAQNVRRKNEIDSNMTTLTTQLDKYQLDIQRSERAYDDAIERFKVVFNQNLELETKIIAATKRSVAAQNEATAFTKKFERFSSIISPMHTFKQMQRVLESCLMHE